MRAACLAVLLAVSVVQSGAGDDGVLPDRAGLRQMEVRDRLLLSHAWGRAFNRAYYQWAPLAELPISLPEERSQKLALVCVSGDADAANLATYLGTRGYQTDRCPSREALEARVAEGGYELAVVEVDADRERPAEVQASLGRAHPRLVRSVLCAIKAGTGRGLDAGEMSQAPGFVLPLRDPGALYRALEAAWSSPRPFGSHCFLIRVGSSPPVIAGALLLAMLLLTVSALILIPRRWRSLAGAALLAALAWSGGVLVLDLGARPSQRAALARLARIREEALAHEGVQRPSAEIDVLADLLDSSDPRLRREAAYTWGVVAMACPGDPRRIDHLMRALEEREDPEDPRVRQWAALALGMSGDTTTVPRLMDALKDPSFLVRNKAALALGQMRDPRAISPLLRMTQEDIWYNAVCARDSLRRLGR